MRITANNVEVNSVGELAPAPAWPYAVFDNGLGAFVAAPNSITFVGDTKRDTFLEIADAPGLRFQNGAFTVAFWIRREPYHKDASNAILNKEQSWEIGLNGSTLQVALDTGSGWHWYSLGVSLKSGVWTHVAWTWDGTYHRLFINGEHKNTMDNGSDGTGNPQANSNPFRIGGRGVGSSGAPTGIGFSIAELKLYDGIALPYNHYDLGFGMFMSTDAPLDSHVTYYFPLHGVGDYQNRAGAGSLTALPAGSNRLIDGGVVYGGSSYTLADSGFSPHPEAAHRGAVGYWSSKENSDTIVRGNWLASSAWTEAKLNRSAGWDRSKNGILKPYDPDWYGGYNSGIPDPDKGYHSHLLVGQGVFGGNAFELANENSYIGHPNRWIAARYDLSDIDDNWSNGDKITVSLYVKAHSPDARIQFGIYHYDPHNSTNDFYMSAGQGLYETPPIGVVDEWVRVEHTWLFDSAYYNNSQTAYLYIYGNTSSGAFEHDFRVLISAPQLEITNSLNGAGGWRAYYDSTHQRFKIAPGIGSYLGGDNDLLVAAMVKKSRDITGDDKYIFHYKQTGEFALYQHAGTIYLHAEDSGGGAVTLSTPTDVLSDGEWHQVAALLRRDEDPGLHDGVHLYVDGALVASDTSHVDSHNNPSGNYIDFLNTTEARTFALIGGKAGGRSLDGVLADLFLASPPSGTDPQPELAKRYNAFIAEQRAGLGYTADGSFLGNVQDGGVVRVLADRDWTVFDPISGHLWGKYGRGYWDRKGLIEEIPYDPFGVALWFGPAGIRNWTTRWGVEGTLHSWHNGMSSSDYEYGIPRGDFYRLYKYPLGDSDNIAEILTSAKTARGGIPKADYTATMRMLCRSDTGFHPGTFSFYTAGGHHHEPVSAVSLGGNTYLCWASHYFQSVTSPAQIRTVDIVNLGDNNYEWLEMGHPTLTQQSGDAGAYPPPFQWGVQDVLTGGGYEAVASSAGFIRFPMASEIIGPQKTGTIIMAFNPANHQPGGYGRLMVAGQDTHDVLSLAYGASYNSGNRIVFNVQKGGTNTFDIPVDHNFQPWTWYYVVAVWGSGSAQLWILDANGVSLATGSATYNDGDFPDFSDPGNNSIVLGKKQAVDDSINAILGPVAFSHAKIANPLDLARHLARGRLALFGRTSYLARPIKTV